VPYLTAQEVRDRARSDSLSDDDVFTDDYLEELVEEFEDIAERYCGVAFIPRTTTETRDVAGAASLILRPRITAVSAFTVDGIASTVYTLTEDVEALRIGVLPFTAHASGSIAVAYTHGYATIPATIRRACVEYVRACALRSDTGTGRDVIQQGFDGGSTRYSTPDWHAGRPTGYIEVDRLLNSNRDFPDQGVA